MNKRFANKDTGLIVATDLKTAKARTAYWIMFAFLLLVMSIFPGVAYFFSDLLGFDSPSNFVFVAVIFLMLMKIFLMSVKISSLENKIVTLVQKYALDGKNDK